MNNTKVLSLLKTYTIANTEVNAISKERLRTHLRQLVLEMDFAIAQVTYSKESMELFDDSVEFDMENSPSCSKEHQQTDGVDVNYVSKILTDYVSELSRALEYVNASYGSITHLPTTARNIVSHFNGIKDRLTLACQATSTTDGHVDHSPRTASKRREDLFTQDSPHSMGASQHQPSNTIVPTTGNFRGYYDVVSKVAPIHTAKANANRLYHLLNADKKDLLEAISALDAWDDATSFHGGVYQLLEVYYDVLYSLSSHIKR